MAADKNEILFSKFGLNYNNESEQFKKGSVIYRDVRHISSCPWNDRLTNQYGTDPTASLDKPILKIPDAEASKTQGEKEKKRRRKAVIRLDFTDIIRDDFWDARPWLFLGR